MMRGINITGNVIPITWYKHIVRESGKPHLLAINLLADIVYWYRPAEERSEQTGEVIGFKKKFAADKLQRSYADISGFFGCSKREATDAVVTLEKLGLIKREFRTINVRGVTSSNVLFIDLMPEQVFAITRDDDSNTRSAGQLSHLNVIPPTFKCETYTESTSEISLGLVSKKEAHASRETPHAKQPAFDALIDSYTDDSELREALRGFVQMRCAMRKRPTNRALELLFQKLDSLAGDTETKIAILNQSILNGWQGVFPLKDEESRKSEKKDDGPKPNWYYG